MVLRLNVEVCSTWLLPLLNDRLLSVVQSPLLVLIRVKEQCIMAEMVQSGTYFNNKHYMTCLAKEI